MRIAYVCNEYPPRAHGGIGTYVQTMSREIANLGHAVTVVGLDEVPEDRRDGDVRVLSLKRAKARGMAWWVNRRRIWSWLSAEANANGIDVVEVPEYEGMLPFAFSSCPVAVRLHLSATTIAQQSGRRPPAILRWCERETLRRHRNWVACSRHAFRLTMETFGLNPRQTPVATMPIPVDIEPSDRSFPGRFVLFAGTVSERKGAVLLARSARSFLATRPDVHLLYAGRQISDATGTLIGKTILGEVGAPLAARVHLLGPLSRPEIRALMGRASVFALPSTLETFGIVIGEAMLSGCPVVVPDAPPFDEIVESGVTGLRVSPPFHAEAWASAIGRVLDDSSLASFLASRAISSARIRHSPAESAAEAIAFYRDLIALHDARAASTGRAR